ncbi:MAG TPA: bifunctional riboflavin kinase/FAD synthetase [Candidatus Aquicultor sp.]
MQTIRGVENINDIQGPSAVTIGVFDGVHIGHQAIIKMAVDFAKTIAGQSVVITFEPHPLAIVNPENAPALLSATDLKAEYIAQLGADYLIVIPFSEAIATMEPESFIDDLLIGKLHAEYIVVGEDFSFGKSRRGTTGFLSTYGHAKGINTVVVPHIREDGVVISSTEVRKRLKSGDIKGVRAMTGRFPRFRGKVIHGLGRGGSTIGFPTANVETLYGELLPESGVYAGLVWVEGKRWPCVVDVGVSPTFGDVAKTEIQVHILGFKKDIYGKRIDVELVDRLRAEMTFNNVDELKKQILLDIGKARGLLARIPG